MTDHLSRFVCRLIGHRWRWRKNAHNVAGTWVDEWYFTRCGAS